MLKTEIQSEEIVHPLLWNIAEDQIIDAQGGQERWLDRSIIARVFAYHTVEAYLNYVGERIAPEIWQDERNYFRREPYRGAEGKLRCVMDLVRLPWTPDERPLKTILGLKYFRDLIAHGKSEKLSETVIHPMGTRAPDLISELRGIARQRDTLEMVSPDVEEFLDAIHIRAKPLLKDKDLWFGDKALKVPILPSYRDTIAGRLPNDSD